MCRQCHIHISYIIQIAPHYSLCSYSCLPTGKCQSWQIWGTLASHSGSAWTTLLRASPNPAVSLDHLNKPTQHTIIATSRIQSHKIPFFFRIQFFPETFYTLALEKHAVYNQYVVFFSWAAEQPWNGLECYWPALNDGARAELTADSEGLSTPPCVTSCSLSSLWLLPGGNKEAPDLFVSISPPAADSDSSCCCCFDLRLFARALLWV